MPVTVTTTVPAAVNVQESVEVGESVVTLAGVRVQAELLAVRATVPEKPLRGVRVIVEVPGEPTVVVTVVGVAVKVKSAIPVTV